MTSFFDLFLEQFKGVGKSGGSRDIGRGDWEERKFEDIFPGGNDFAYNLAFSSLLISRTRVNAVTW
jgi:hypothetical protein